MAYVNRYDFVPLGHVTRTPQGFLRFNANLTRAGILEYRRSDGTIQRELRHPDEVFKSASLATLSGAPVTDQHKAMVTPDNATGLTVGITSENIGHDNRFVTGKVTIWDSGIINMIGNNERKELSPGYRCELDRTPGEYNGEKYDAIQKNIVYNHIGIGPEGWGRSGSDVALRLDGDDAASCIFLPEMVSKTIPNKEKQMKIRIDGIEYEAGSDAAIQAMEKLQSRMDADNKNLQTQKAELEEKLAKTEGRADAAEAKVKELEEKLEKANDPVRFDAAISERAELVSKARDVLGQDVDLAGKTPRQIKEAVLIKLDENSKFDDKSDAYIDGAYEHAITHFKPESHVDGNASVRTFLPFGTPQKGENPKEKYDSRTARQKMLECSENAWKQDNTN